MITFFFFFFKQRKTHLIAFLKLSLKKDGKHNKQINTVTVSHLGILVRTEIQYFQVFRCEVTGQVGFQLPSRGPPLDMLVLTPLNQEQCSREVTTKLYS